MAAPLSKVDEIVMLGGDGSTTSEVTKLLAELPPAVQAVTGVDISKVRHLFNDFRKGRKKGGFTSLFPRFAGSDVLILCMSTTTHSLSNQTLYWSNVAL